MSSILQNILALLIVAVCTAVIARQGYRTLTLRGRGKLGACCAKGCDVPEKVEKKSQPVHFMPVEMLSRRR